MKRLLNKHIEERKRHWNSNLRDQKKTFHFNLPTSIEASWMIGLMSLEEYNSTFNITEENNKIELYNIPGQKIGDVSYTKVRDEIERGLDVSDITATDLLDDLLGPIIFDG